jgi:hypothetical protein
MSRKSSVISSALGALLLFAAALAAPGSASAQQPQIPTLQVCNGTVASGGGMVKLAKRAFLPHSGVFQIGLNVKCTEAGYPVGVVELKIDMSDSQIQGLVKSILIEQLTSTGRDTPTAYLNGRCEADGVVGCRFWLMVADNGAEQDVVSFLIFDGKGHRVAYGTGQLNGSVNVMPTAN